MNIILYNDSEGVPVNAYSVKLKDATNTYGVKRAATGTVVVSPTSAIAPTSLGVYSYGLADNLTPGVYYAAWEIIDTLGADPRYHPHVFSIDAVVTISAGVTLMELERLVADRIGPFLQATATGGDTSSITLPRFKSSLFIHDDNADLYLLRRGFLNTGLPVPGFNDDDRVRVVAEVITDTGALSVDRLWTVAPVNGEDVELTYLHPEKIRAAVQVGLGRCYRPDRASVTVVANTTELNISAALPWVRDPLQIRRVTWLPTALSIPYDVWYEPSMVAGEVLIRMARTLTYGTLQIYTMRPADSYVNGSTSFVGPDDDQDQVLVPRLLAVASGHLAAWKTCRADLQAAAVAGERMSQLEVAREFTKLSREYRSANARRAPTFTLGAEEGGWPSAMEAWV